MNLEGKKILAARTLNVGKGRIILNVNRLPEIKEAITKQDIRDLLADGAIFIKEIKGRKAVEKRTTRRRAGSIRKKVRNKKREYITITRKLRSHLSDLRNREKINEEQYIKLRKGIRAHTYKNKTHFKEHITL